MQQRESGKASLCVFIIAASPVETVRWIHLACLDRNQTVTNPEAQTYTKVETTTFFPKRV